MSNYFVFFFLGCNCLTAQSITGTWYAKTTSMDTAVHFILDLRDGEQGLYGKLDIPGKNVFRIDLDSVQYSQEAGTLHLEHQKLDFQFNGKLLNEQHIIPGRLSGNWESSGFVWHKQPQVPRTQAIVPPLPYESNAIQFENKTDHIQLAGTLTVPAATGKFPAIVLISGSGPQNRDQEILGHKPFQVLADHLSRNGIAVLRYDDRGTARSGGQFRPATSEDYGRDALAAVSFLKQHPNIDTTRIGLAGHSEGGNIAPMLAAGNPDIAFLVLLAAPGVSNLEMYLTQLDKIFQDYPEAYDRDVPFWRSVYRCMASIDDKAMLSDTLAILFDRWGELLPEEERAEYGDLEAYKTAEIRNHTTEWYHYFLQFDIGEYLPKLSIPILALNGDKDFQVDARQNLKALEAGLAKHGHPKNTFVELPNVNHFMQPCRDGNFQEIYFEKVSFSPVALEKISTWIKALN